MDAVLKEDKTLLEMLAKARFIAARPGSNPLHVLYNACR